MKDLELQLDHQSLRDLYVLLKSREDHLSGNLRSLLLVLQSRIYDHYSIEELEELNRSIDTK
ncbi:MAG: hypothetical protein JXR70_13770 [Spirochaetales bacterium]|nr:hypothetical protein [Spirochaetales bacterium]